MKSIMLLRLLTRLAAAILLCYAPAVFAQDGLPPESVNVGAVERARVRKARAQLAELLPDVVVGTEAVARSMYPAEGRPYRIIWVEWEAYVGAPELVDTCRDGYPPGDRMKVVKNEVRHGSLSMRRGFDPAQEFLFIATDGERNLRWWGQGGDPRVVRAPLPPPGPSGGHGCSLFHRSKPTFTLAVPEDEKASALKFYLLEGGGGKIALRLIGSVAL